MKIRIIKVAIVILLISPLTIYSGLKAQVTIGTGEPPAKGALLELKDNNPDKDNITSKTGGLVLPRVKLENNKTLEPFIKLNDNEWSTSQINETKRIHTGLMVYNLNTENNFQQGIYVWDGNQWMLSGANDAWLKMGNSATNSTQNFIGTTDDADLVIKTNNSEAMRIASSGNLGVGTSSPDKSALVDINSTNKGILIPRVALQGKTDQTTITSPATGLLVYNTTYNDGTSYGGEVIENTFYTWSGSSWDPMMSKTTINTMRIPEPAIFQLETNQLNFLNGVKAGNKKSFPVTQVINSVPDKIRLTNKSTIRFQPGVYQISFVYEAIVNANCNISSYFVDFPTSSTGVQRIHSTAYHKEYPLSNHGGTITYSFKTDAVTDWAVALGRGQSGDCWKQGDLSFLDNMELIAKSTHIMILRLGDY